MLQGICLPGTAFLLVLHWEIPAPLASHQEVMRCTLSTQCRGPKGQRERTDESSLMHLLGRFDVSHAGLQETERARAFQ